MAQRFFVARVLSLPICWIATPVGPTDFVWTSVGVSLLMKAMPQPPTMYQTRRLREQARLLSNKI